MKLLLIITTFVTILTQNTFDYKSDAGTTCQYQICSPLSLCSITGGDCVNGQCICKKGYITYHNKRDDYSFNLKSPEAVECCYESKSKLTVVLIEFLIGFGFGHLYAGRHTNCSIKMAVMTILAITSIFIIRKLYKDRKKDKHVIFNVLSIVTLFVCIATYLVWQILDSILFIFDIFTDGSNQKLT